MKTDTEVMSCLLKKRWVMRAKLREIPRKTGAMQQPIATTPGT